MTNNSVGRVQPQRVQLFAGNDFRCALLGSLGFSTKFIESQTGLTVSQIGYRLRRASIKRSDYRNGSSSISTAVLNQTRMIAIPAVEQHLRNVIGEYENRGGISTTRQRDGATGSAATRTATRSSSSNVAKKEERAA